MKTTHALIMVMIVLADDPSSRHWGYDLGRRSGVRFGVLYRILQRMLDEGWLADGWEDQAGSGKQLRPPRRYYQVTASGRAALAARLGSARSNPRFSHLFGPA